MKRYAEEAGASLVRRLSDIVVSQLARVEVPGAIWRKHRLGQLSSEHAATLVEAFEWEWFDGSFAVVGARDDVVDSAARLLALHPLRSLDAVQLATALTAREADPDLSDFVCFDRRLTEAARAEGFRTVP